MDRFCYFLSFRLLSSLRRGSVRNLSVDVFIIQVSHQGIPLPDKLYLALPAHILYLFFSDYGTPAIAAILVINKLMQVILCCEAMGVEVVLMFIYSSYELICHPNIQRRSCIGHNIHSKNTLHHSAIISERFRARAGMTSTQKPKEPLIIPPPPDITPLAPPLILRGGARGVTKGGREGLKGRAFREFTEKSGESKFMILK